MPGGWVGWAILAAIPLGYVVSCIDHPQRDCYWCRGQGVFRSNSVRALTRRCWWCKGVPRRDRFGTRLWKRWRR
ncbi:hypothetical protein [Micromonospora chersina]|uniref:hypothetical protein n=1 Tax=Micromonospora chersina TaxID=47854 RepID=UPI0033C87F3D